MKKFTASLFLLFLVLCSKSQTTFRLGYGGAFGIPIAGGMVQNPVGDFVFDGTNATFGAVGNITKITNSGTTVWSKSYSAGFFTQFNDLKNVSAGNGGGYIAAGGGTSGGGGAVLVRIDDNGVPLWSFQYQYPNAPTGNPSSEYANAVMETSDGGFIVGGAVDYFYDGTTRYDTTLAFGFKVNSAGILQWNKVWKTPSTLAGAAADINYDENYINDVAETADGYFFVGQVADVTQATGSNGDKPSRALLIKTDKATGALTYIRTWGSGTNSTGINSAIKLADGNILLGGFDNNSAFMAKIAGTGAVPTLSYNKKISEGGFFPSPWLIRNVMQNSDGNYSAICMRIDPLNISGPLSSAIIKLDASTGAIMIKKNYPGLGPLGASILPKGGLAVSDQGYYALMTDTDTTGYCFSAFKTDNLGDMPHTATSCNPATPSPTVANYTITYSTPSLTEYTTLTGASFTPVVANLNPVKNVYCVSVACVPPAAATTVTATPNTICAGQTSSITASGPATGVTYNVFTSATGGSSIGTTPLTVSPSSTTTYYIETTLSPTCVSNTRTSVTITVTPVVVPTTGFSYTSPVCANGTNPSPIPVAGFTTGGTYTSTAGLTINSSTGVITLSSSTPGTYTVTYTVAASGCNPAGSSTANIIINPVTTPGTNFSYTSPVCANGTDPSPSPGAGFTSGGTYTSTGGLTINSATGVITLSSSTPGTYTVTYSVAASGCQSAGSGTATITINPVITPGTNFSYTSPVCANGTNPTPIPGAGFTSGGTYSSTAGLAINSSTGVITLSSSTPGSYIVTYTVAASGCTVAGTGTAAITINPVTAPVTNFSYSSPVCVSGTNPTPVPGAGFTTGGTYTSTSGLTINASSGVIDLSTTTPGTYTVTYSVPATACGPAGSGTATITINGTTPPGTSFSYSSPVCITGSNPSPIMGAGFTPGGSYTSTSGLTIDVNSGVIDLSTSTAGTYTITYSVSSSGCISSGSGTATITINSTTTPVTGFSYTTPVCANGTNPTPIPAGGFVTGGTYSSTSGLTINSGTGVIDLSTSTPGTYTVTYSVTASGCMAAGNSTANITINPTTTPTTAFSYTTPVCANGTNPTPIPAGGFVTGGTYSSTSGLTINSGTGVIDLSTSTPGTYTVTYALAASGCSVANSSTANITINPTTTPVTGFSYSSPSVCINSINPQPTPIAGFTTGGVYSSTSGLTINASSGVIDLSTSTPGTYTVTYFVAATSCGPAGTSTATIAIKALPAISTGSNSAVCQGSTLNLTASGGANYNWAGPGGYTSPLQNPSITNVTTGAAGSYTVTVIGANGCSNTGTTSVVINPSPAINISGTTTVCSGASTTLTAFGGNTYLWNTGSSSQAITVSPVNNTTYTVTGTDLTGCSASQAVTVTTTALPVATITGSSNVCSGQSTMLTANGGPGYLWSNGATTQSIIVNPVTASTYSVTVGTGCTDTASITITVNTIPTAGITGVTSITLGANTTLTASGGSAYSWSPSTGLSCTACVSTIASPVTTTQYCVIADNSGCTDTACVTIKVDIQCGELFIPTAFSPNNDGENEKLIVMGNCIEELMFAIYDRWGEKVFETSDPTFGWDGTYKGKALDAAVFVYYLKAKVNGHDVDKHGNITLVK